MSNSPPIINSALRRVTTTKSDEGNLTQASSEARASGQRTPTRVTSVSQRQPTKQAQHHHIAERLARTRALIKRQQITHVATSINKSVGNTVAQASTRIDHAPLRPTIVSVPKKPFERLHASRHAITVALSSLAQTPIEALPFEKKETLATTHLTAANLLATQSSSANVALRLPPNVFLQLPPTQKIYQQTKRVENDAQRMVRLTPHPPHLPIYSHAKALENPQGDHSRLKTSLLSDSHPAIYAELDKRGHPQDHHVQLKSSLQHSAHLAMHRKEIYKAQYLDTHLKANLKALGIAYRAQTRKLEVENQNSLWEESAKTAPLDALTNAKKEIAVSNTQRQAHVIGFAQEQIAGNNIANRIGTKPTSASTLLPRANRVRQGPFRMVSQSGSLKSLGVNETPLAKIKSPALGNGVNLNRGTINTIRTKLYHDGKLQAITISKTTTNTASALPTPPSLTAQSPTATVMPAA